MLEYVITLGFAAYGTVAFVRALPGVKVLIAKEIKPFACDLCMSLWATMTWVGGYWLAGYQPDPLLASGGAGLSLALISFLSRMPPSSVPDFAPLDGEE